MISEGGQPLLHESITLADQQWLADQLTTRGLADWMTAMREQQLTAAWTIPDADRPLTAILMIVPERSDSLFLASFALESMWQPIPLAAGNEFQFRLWPHAEDPEPGRGEAIHEHARLDLPGGPTLGITATAAPVSLTALPGALIPFILAFGLLMSYLLTVGRIIAVQQRRSALALSTKEQRFRSLFFQSPDAVFEFTRDGRYVSLNARAKAITGITDQNLGTLGYHDVLSAEAMSKRDFAIFDNAFKRTIEGIAQTFSVRFLNIDGEWREYECSFIPVLVNDAVTGMYAVVKDVTERLLAQENQRLLTRSLESSDSAVLVMDIRDPAMPVVFANAAFSEMTGCNRDEVLSRSFSTITSAIEGAHDVELIMRTIANGETRSFTIRSCRRDGTAFWNQLSLTPVKNEDGDITHYTALMKDVSDRKEHERQLAYQATHDLLTGLPNRTLFEDRLEHDIAMARRNDAILAVMFIDLDAFKPINDTLGHRVGDEILISAAKRLQEVVRPSDTLARFGGDEFVLLLPDLDTIYQAELVADCILRTISRPHRVGPHELHVTASIGISFLADDLDAPARMLQQADMAMYQAKQQGRDAFVIFSQDIDERLSKRVTLRNELQEAITQGQLFLNYQPQLGPDGQLCGVEALVRWRHPVKGLISPAEFIPVAEETGQIMQLGGWVITQACRDARQLLDMGLLGSRVAVNLSPLQFHRPGFLTRLRSILQQTGLPATFLELELTEGILMRNSEAAINTLYALKKIGVTTSIDDFGTGFSSFSYLKDLPVESVKIDRSFVDNLITNRKDAAVCKGIIAMASELGMTVVAEGVESREQFEQLKTYGCNVFQGYYFARPMGLNELIAWAQQRRPDAN